MSNKSAPRNKQQAASKNKRKVENGRAIVNATFNNTLVYLTDSEGNVLAWATAGGEGFKGSRKSTPFAASQAAKKAAEKAQQAHGLRQIDVYMNGPGPGRESAVKALGDIFRVTSISDVTPIPHNGVRAKKERRV